MSKGEHIYIPHRAPFIMIGDVTYAEGNITRTTFTVTEDNIFNTGGYFSEGGMIENMAQTAGAGTRYRAIKENKNLPGGYIAALKNLNIISRPRVNETITTEVVVLNTVLSFHLVQGKIMLGDTVIAECEFKIFLTTSAS